MKPLPLKLTNPAAITLLAVIAGRLGSATFCDLIQGCRLDTPGGAAMSRKRRDS